MSDDKPAPLGPLANMINEAKEGRLRVRMDPEQFVYIDRDCEFFKEQIGNIQGVMDQIAAQPRWGLGEDYVGENGKELVSGKTMAERYRLKAKDSDNSVWSVMESHYQVVNDIQALFRTIRERYSEQDDKWGAHYRDLEANLPQQPPAPQRIFSWPMPSL
jgi:hypothetical protein